MKNQLTNSGQSLLEMVFAIGLLLIAVSAIVALTTANVSGQKETEFQITANNLAREGVEVVRNIRDSNWLAGTAWDSGLNGGNQAIPVFDPEANEWQLDFSSPNPAIVYLNNQGIYHHRLVYPSDNPTVYRRILYLKNICLKSSGEEYIQDSCDSNDVKIGLDLKSLVLWPQHNQTRQVQLEDLIYAWK